MSRLAASAIGALMLAAALLAMLPDHVPAWLVIGAVLLGSLVVVLVVWAGVRFRAEAA